MHFPRIAYTDDSGTPWDFTLMRAVRPWTPSSVGVGGREFSAARVASSYEVRRDHTLALTMRFTEAEWPALRRALEHGGRSTAITIRLGGVSRSCHLIDPAVDEDIVPRRGDFPGDLEIDTLWVDASDTGWDDARVFDAMDIFIRDGAMLSERDFARASEATFTSEDGLVETVAAGILRDKHYIGGKRSVLLEPASENRLATPAAFNSWTKQDILSVTSDAATIQGVPVDLIIPNATNAVHYVHKTTADSVAAGGKVVVSAWVAKGGGYNFGRITLAGCAFASATQAVDFNLEGESVTISAGTATAEVVHIGGNLYRVTVFATATDTGMLQARLYVKNNSGTLVYAGDGTSGLYAWLAVVEFNRTFPTSPFTAATRAVDVLSRTMPSGTALPTDPWARLTRWVAGMDGDGGLTAPRIWEIGASGGALMLLQWPTSTTLRLSHFNGSTTEFAEVTVNVGRGDTVEALATKASDGSGVLAIWVNGVFIDSAVLAALAPASEWNGGATTYLNSRAGGSNPGVMAARDDAFLPGDWSGVSHTELLARFRRKLKVAA